MGTKFDEAVVHGDPVALTEQRLAARIPRQADHARENAALLALADEMAQQPNNVLNLLCELVLDVCDADSAGVSLLDEARDEFVWPAVAGAWAPFVHGTMPRAASPCGKVIEHDRVLIFRNVVEQFPAAAQASPAIEEILLAPFHREGKPIGTVWAISHGPKREFDSEDLRILTDISRFAAAAYELTSAQQSAKSAQEQLAVSNRELGHRLKNLLSMVVAITGQTLRGKEVQERSAVLQSRFEALGAAHNVLIEQEAPAASIAAVAGNVFSAIGQTGRVLIEGPEILLGPKTALACSLVLHELGTHALKYGALSNDDGRVSLSWLVDENGSEPTIMLSWAETGGPSVAKPKRQGFGTKLVKMGLTGSGETMIDYHPDGLRMTLSAPLAEASAL